MTTPAFTMRGSMPRPVSAKSTVEKSPKAATVVARDSMSPISGIENVMFSEPMPGALCRI